MIPRLFNPFALAIEHGPFVSVTVSVVVWTTIIVALLAIVRIL